MPQRHSQLVVTAALLVLVISGSDGKYEPDLSALIVDCRVTWEESWTKCSRAGTQTRRYKVSVYPTRSGNPCPTAPQTRGCTYSGPRVIPVDGDSGRWAPRNCTHLRTVNADSRVYRVSERGRVRGRSDVTAGRGERRFPGETHETFDATDLCQYEPLQATVGDVVVFEKDSALDDLVLLPSQWHFAKCIFSDGFALLGVSAGQGREASNSTRVNYTVGEADRDKRLYIASSRAGACREGQRVLLTVDSFQQGTLAESLDLAEREVYQTIGGAERLLERIWCFEDHCPESALGFYEGDPQAAQHLSLSL